MSVALATHHWQNAPVLEDGLLAFLLGLVQGARATFSAGAVFHDAAGDAEGSFYYLHRLPERYLARRSCKPGAPAAALFALDQARAGELGQDAGQQAARDVGFD
jgi:hypothetical protein